MSYRPVNTNPPRRRHKTPAEIRRDYGPALDAASKELSKALILWTTADAYFESGMDYIKDAGLKYNGLLGHAVATCRRGHQELVTAFNTMMSRHDRAALGNDFSEMLPRIEDYLNRTLLRIGQAPQENLQGLMTAGELIERLRQYPADAAVVIEYCDPRSMTYNEERNIIKID